MSTTPAPPNPANEFVNLTELHQLALDIALEAGALQLQHLHGTRTVDHKSSPTDAVTEVDRACEALIVQRIIEARPHDSILGEEGAANTGPSAVRWVVDPLDGTVNYLYRRSDFAVSIGIEFNGLPTVGVVHDPSHRETFHAIAGNGAYLRRPLSPTSTDVTDTPIHTNPITDLNRALIGTGFGYDTDVRRAQGRLLAHVIPHVRDIRRAGSAALDICHVACGRLDGYFERGVQHWDIAAARVIATEAGATLHRLDPPEVPAPTYVIAPPPIHPPLRELVVEGSNPQPLP